ncbi:MAG TPA: transposase, partial [Bryobacteraceae bacterium]|nr:transposase [Bryobacteraceae bacterium]
TRTKKGNKYLRRVLTQAAWAVSHCKHGYLRAFFYRVKARRGWGKAIMAVEHKILVFAYCILKTGIPYQDLGDNYFDKLHPERVAHRLLHRRQVAVPRRSHDVNAADKRSRSRVSRAEEKMTHVAPLLRSGLWLSTWGRPPRPY